MTNREELILTLQGKHPADDSGTRAQSNIYYNIACPYSYFDTKAECHGIADDINYDICTKCKEKWLDSEVEE